MPLLLFILAFIKLHRLPLPSRLLESLLLHGGSQQVLTTRDSLISSDIYLILTLPAVVCFVGVFHYHSSFSDWPVSQGARLIAILDRLSQPVPGPMALARDAYHMV